MEYDDGSMVDLQMQKTKKPRILQRNQEYNWEIWGLIYPSKNRIIVYWIENNDI